MTDHPLSKPPMRRSLTRPPAQPASSCPQCYRNGHVAPDQHDDHGHQRIRTIRFYCPNCQHDWSTNAHEAELHGIFLQRINQTTQRDL